jgi:ribonucleoside-diphosphate reductase alpha chain
MRVAEREKLPNRREATTFDVEAGGLRYRATIGRYGDGRLAEIFIDMSKVGSDADAAARDCAIATSLALQWGADPEVLRKAMCRDARGKAVGPVGLLLDRLAERGDVT